MSVMGADLIVGYDAASVARELREKHSKGTLYIHTAGVGESEAFKIVPRRLPTGHFGSRASAALASRQPDARRHGYHVILE